LIVGQLARRFTLPRTRAILRKSGSRGVFFCGRVVALAAWANFLRLPSDVLTGRGPGRISLPERVPVPVRHTEKGQTLIEFAFAFPLLLIFILLVVDFGFALDRREVIQHAVREGARAGAVGASPRAITDHTNEQSGGAFDSVTVCYIDGNDANSNPGNAGDSVRVSGTYTYDFAIGNTAFLGSVIPSVDMTPSAEARLEKSVPGAIGC
jgi:hypothetical protein